MRSFDAIVVGAGPAGSVTAYHLSSAGLGVLLVDRASFPRDKPCGGGLTGRALRQLPIDVEGVVEETVDLIEVRLRGGAPLLRRGRAPLILMTQRRRLDLHLAEAAIAAGAEFRDGARPSSVTSTANGVTVAFARERVRADVIVAADGANGNTARAAGLPTAHSYGIAYEGNARASQMQNGYSRRALIDLGDVAGGYGWVFPKADHVNVGVGGWLSEGPMLRSHLARVLRRYGRREVVLENVRGHRLPLRSAGARLANERALLVGDAAGLVDPLSGDGMYECFVSARLASSAILDLLEGRSVTLEAYTRELTRELGRHLAASWGARRTLDRFPALAFHLLRLAPVWDVVERLLVGDIGHPGSSHGAVRAPLGLIDFLARASGDPGRPYRAEAAR
jgi:geranylgeranyl reductase family protein